MNRVMIYYIVTYCIHTFFSTKCCQPFWFYQILPTKKLEHQTSVMKCWILIAWMNFSQNLTFYLWNNGWLWRVNSKSIRWIVHETLGIIGNIVSQCSIMLLKVVFLSLLDVVPHDGDILITIRSTLDMELSKGMNKLMLNGSKWNCNLND